MAANVEQFGEWRTMRELGTGGQGTVYLARRLSREDSAELNRVLPYISKGRTRMPGDPSPVDALLDILAIGNRVAYGALKVLHPPELAKNAKTSRERFRREIETLRLLRYPGLVEVLDVDEELGWFVMAFYSNGKLTQHRDKYTGETLAALRALRPIVEAVAQLHKQGFVHRDIKPDNIFIAADEALVLGDFGLIHPGEDAPRLTGTYENVGSWEWMPTWAQGGYDGDVPKSFDVFTLGKVLWWMISGKTFLRFHYFRDPEFDLEQLFPGSPEMRNVNALLDKAVCERREQGFQDAEELLGEMDVLVGSLRPSSRSDVDACALARAIFPGTWRLEWTKKDGTAGKEEFTISEEGAYLLHGKPKFSVRVLHIEVGHAVVLERRSNQDKRRFLETLEIASDDRREGYNQFGTHLAYMRLPRVGE